MAPPKIRKAHQPRESQPDQNNNFNPQEMATHLSPQPTWECRQNPLQSPLPPSQPDVTSTQTQSAQTHMETPMQPDNTQTTATSVQIGSTTYPDNYAATAARLKHRMAPTDLRKTQKVGTKT